MHIINSKADNKTSENQKTLLQLATDMSQNIQYIRHIVEIVSGTTVDSTLPYSDGSNGVSRCFGIKVPAELNGKI